jgi:hypothetical protein
VKAKIISINKGTLTFGSILKNIATP